MRTLTALGAALLLLAGTARADSFETSTRATEVPADSNGSLLVRPCSTCAPTLVRLTGESQFKVGRTEVDFAEFRRVVAEGGERYLNVSYDPATGNVIRLRLSGTLPRRPSR
ncbi:MAG: hypothetical protein HC872_06765 [Gammaproteobacteria bacterium]|nr:hypothetical protein [Gammaproteobacteria bacterium]